MSTDTTDRELTDDDLQRIAAEEASNSARGRAALRLADLVSNHNTN